MSIATRTADPTGTARRRAVTGAVAVDDPSSLPVRREPYAAAPVVVLDLPRVAERFREVRAAVPWMDVRYDVCALAHPALLRALAAEGAGFVVSQDAALPALQRTGADLGRVLYATDSSRWPRRRAAWTAGVRRFVIDDLRDLDDFAGAPGGTAVVLRLGPAAAVEAARYAASIGVRVAGLSLRASHGHNADSLLDAVQAAVATASRLAAQTGRRLEVLDLGESLCRATGGRPQLVAALGRSVRSLVAPATSGTAVIASAGRTVAADAITIVAGGAERYADAAAASEFIDAGAEVLVLRRRQRIARPARARATWSTAG